MKGTNLLAIAFRLVGFVFAGISLVVAVTSAIFVVQARRVPGSVIDFSIVDNSIRFPRGDEPTGLLYYPVIAYQIDGVQHEFTGRRGSVRPAYELGGVVDVLVSESRPPSARLDTTMGVWGSSIILGSLAALFLLLSVLAPYGFGGSPRT